MKIFLRGYIDLLLGPTGYVGPIFLTQKNAVLQNLTEINMLSSQRSLKLQLDFPLLSN